MKEAATNTCRIEFGESVVEAIRIMLDFMYAQKLGIITPEQAVLLLFLAEYFAIELLNCEVMLIVKKDMNSSNVHRYLDSAKILNDSRLQEIFIQVMSVQAKSGFQS